MEGIEKPHTDKYKEITNNWNYDTSCTLTSIPVWDLENFKLLIFVVQSVQILPLIQITAVVLLGILHQGCNVSVPCKMNKQDSFGCNFLCEI
jgi:hypothetical protein